MGAEERNVRTVRVLAPAKINLTLRVLGRRADGYHELCSLVTGVGLSDTLWFDPTESGRISLSCDDPELPTDERNLVVRAAHRLAERAGGRGVHIRLEKSIPIAAGMGGGSSDAAATLRALNSLWEAGLDPEELSRLGAELGSDVPLFFHLPAAVIQGRGEIVRPVRLRWAGWAGLVFGGMPVATKEVYAALDARREIEAEDGAAIEAILSATRAEAIGPHLCNDLEPAVFRVSPAMERLFGQVRDGGGRFARISGAGSTVYSLFDDEAGARAWVERLRRIRLGAATAVVRVPDGDPTTP